MDNLIKAKCFIPHLAIIVYFTNMLGCATVSLPSLPDQTIESYKLTQKNDNLVVSIDPFMEKERVEQYFGINLLAEGIMPVYVAVKNLNYNAYFYLPKDRMRLVSDNGQSHIENTGLTTNKPESIYQNASLEVGAWAGSVLLTNGITVLAAPFVLPRVFKAIEDSEIISQNILKKEFLETTLSTGEFQHGFIFFELPSVEGIKNISSLHVRAVNLRNGENLAFIFPIELNQ